MSRYTVVIPTDAPLWAQQLQPQLNNLFARIDADMPQLEYLTVAELPTDGSKQWAIVTNEVGGEVLAFRDSAGAWRRSTDRAIVS